MTGEEYAGELGGFVLARGTLDRVSARRGDTEWLAATWADPAARVLVLDNARALVRFGDKEAELVLVPTAEAPEGLRFLLGVDDADVAYFGVMGPPGGLESVAATENPPDHAITGEAQDAAPAGAAEAPAQDGPEEEAPGPAGSGTGAQDAAGETSAGKSPAGETSAGEVPAGETSAGETSAGGLAGRLSLGRFPSSRP